MEEVICVCTIKKGDKMGKLKGYEFIYKLETEAKTKEEALENFQFQMHEDSLANPKNVGDVKEIK